ncbi:right-handed parallel beta-helix repeat-containing protein [Jannaschia pohangensis]|uniref:Right handed beta helix region n=1 Tax=Jannaschia pohangensis TaxID=390807 RepID=A0A1I3TS14_9RHOB|nr:right-handed parallel beta-helix repeat-containing protein [Jannaschia pohangensis]SFJ74054.1 Right handed beta helix region [Jannaschia pohangensis]
MILQLIPRAILALVFLTLPVSARTVEVMPDTLVDALAQAQPGDVLDLLPGDYPALHITRGGTDTAPITLRAADRGDRPVFNEALIDGAANLKLDGLVFDLVSGPLADRASFRIEGAAEIGLTDMLFDGAERPVQGGGNEYWGLGLVVEDTRGLRLTNSEFRNMERGLIVARVSDALIQGNLFHSMRSDGMNFAQVEDIRIIENHLRDFARSEASDDHPDMIQFWTRGTDEPSRQIVIRDNILNAGGGYWTQSIFMRNEMVDTGQAGARMFYRDVVIEGNVVINAHLHGISVGAVNGLTIRRNTVVRTAFAEGAEHNPGLWTPQIRVSELAKDVLILGNVAHKVPDATWHEDWVVVGNTLVQDILPGQEDHFDRVFNSAHPTRAARVEDFVARPGGVLDGSEVGAPYLVALAKTLDLEAPEDAVSIPHELAGTIRFVPEDGVILADGGAGNPPLEHLVGGPVIHVGNTVNPLVLSRAMTAPLYDASGFQLRLRVASDDNYRGAGEIIRLHQALKVWADGRGVINVEVHTDGGRTIRMQGPATRLFRGDPVEFSVTYAGPDGLLRLLDADGVVLKEVTMTGQLPARNAWGLSFGNPFGTHDSFAGRVEAFELTANGNDFSEIAPTQFRYRP